MLKDLQRLFKDGYQERKESGTEIWRRTSLIFRDYYGLHLFSFPVNLTNQLV